MQTVIRDGRDSRASDGVETRRFGRLRLSPHAIGRIAFVVAFLYLAVIVNPRFIRHMDLGIVLPDLNTAEPAISVALGMLLLGLARSLGRGKRRAWQLTVVILAVQVVVHARQHHWGMTLLSVVFLILLLITRAQFVGKPDPSSARHVAAVGSSMLTVSFIVGWTALTLLAHQTHAAATGLDRVWQTVQGLVGVPSVLTNPEGRAQDVVYYLLLGLGLTTGLVTSAVAFRTARGSHVRSDEEEAELRAVLRRGATADSLDYFATRDDRALAWSPNRGACISYRVIAGTALAAGNPIGVGAQWPDAIKAFLDECREYAWIPAVVAASQEGAQAWQKWGGLSVLEFGDEAILERDEYTLEGREMRNVRHAVTRAAKAGYTVRMGRLGDLDADLVRQLGDLAVRWRVGDVERGFSMGLGRFDAARDPESLVVTAWLDGEPAALLVFVPWGRDGLSLDLMRRAPGSESGVNELMISHLMEHMGEVGVQRVSLNFAAFRDAIERAERIGAGPATRAWGNFLKTISKWSQADSLYRFNAKFRPTWNPRYIAYRSASGLPRLAIAYLDAEALVTLPRPIRRARGEVTA